MKLNDNEEKKIKTRLIVSWLLGVSIGIVSGLTNTMIGLIPCVFFLGISVYYYIIGLKYIQQKHIQIKNG